MNAAEAQTLLTMAATVDNRKPDEDAAKAWAVLLDGLRVDDCREVVIRHYRESSEWLTPAIIRAKVKALREKRLADHPEPTPPNDLTPVETVEWLRRTRQAIADGNPPQVPAIEAKPRDMSAVESTFRKVPADG